MVGKNSIFSISYSGQPDDEDGEQVSITDNPGKEPNLISISGYLFHQGQ